MLPTRLELKNFLAYRSPDPIIFEGLHLACLSGANGAGKSSLLEAITWALWGKARVRTDDDLIHQGQTDMVVQLDFLQGDNRYRVVRKRQRGKTARTGSSRLHLHVWDDDTEQFVEITAPSIRETEKRIVELLRLDYETFVNSAFLQQGRADAFTIKTPAQRKDVLGEILGLDRWKEYEERAKERLRRVEHDLSVINLGLAGIAEREAEEPVLLRTLADTQAALADAVRKREEAEASYNEVAGAEEQMRAAQQRLAHAQNRLRVLQGELVEVAADLDKHTATVTRLTDIIQARDSIEAGYAELQRARDADRALGQKLQQMNSVKDRLSEVERRLDAARAELEAQASVHRDRIQQAAQQADDLDELRADAADVGAEVARLEGEEARREDVRAVINTCNEEAAELRATNKALYAEMQALRARIDAVQAAEAVCPTCGQPLDDEQKTTLIAELEADGTARRDIYRDHQQRLDAITDEIAAHRAAIDAIDAELRRLPALRDRAARLSADVELARSAASTVESEQASLEAVTAVLESGDYAAELRAQVAAVQQEIEALGYDSDAHSAARETLDTYHTYERRQQELALAQEQLPEAQTMLANTEARRARWQERLGEEQADADAAQAEIDGLQAQVEEAQRRHDVLRQCNTAERTADNRVMLAQQALTALDELRRQKEGYEQRAAQLHEEQGVFEDLRDAFGKNGVPAMIIEAAIPELEEAANRLLTRMTEGRMHVRLDTQREKRTGGVAETLDILISDELGTRSYEAYSGGEAFRVNFAIRVALSQMLARRSGAQLRALFMDEGFGTQDEIGRQRLVEAITAVQDHFDLVLVITHVEELRDAFPVQIEISKTPDGSRVRIS